ncbi:MAG: hypothetical protein WBL68_18505 [Nitrososphaeraceae archaeon]
MDTTVNTTITTKKTNMVIEVLLFVIHKSANANLLKNVEESAHYVDLSRDYVIDLRAILPTSLVALNETLPSASLPPSLPPPSIADTGGTSSDDDSSSNSDDE